MKKIFQTHKVHWSDKKFLKSSLSGGTLFILSLIVNYYAGSYATEKASNSVTDFILSNVRVFDVDGVFIYGTFFFGIFVIVLTLLKPQKIPFTVKAIALFVLIRSVFISLTHIGLYPSHLIVDSSFLNIFGPGGDLFFSGHTGLPFLMALIYWEHKYLRPIFIVCSFTFGAVVLLGHLHYSIDVLSAFFITYSIYRIAEIFFEKDKKLFMSGVQSGD